MAQNAKWSIYYWTNSTKCDMFGSTCGAYSVVDETNRLITIVFRGTKTPEQLLTEGLDSTEPNIDFFNVGLVSAEGKGWRG